jgi:signal transduction histidine kinase/ActR/RegA family two-component response regulator
MPNRGYATTCLVTPHRADAELSLALLAENDISARACSDLRELALIFEDGVGCVVVVEDSLTKSEVPLFADLLAHQPAWRDVPLVIITRHAGHMNDVIAAAFPASGNVTLLEQPVSPATLISAVRVGLRATTRQLEVRTLLEERNQAVRARDEFLAMLAHELRNPLAPMRNALAIQKMLNIDDPTFEQMHGVLERQLLHVVRMVDDLVDVARLERGKLVLRMERIDLNEIVASALESCQSAATAGGHELESHLESELIPLNADPTRIEQIVCNLVTNAAKFTTTPSVIRVVTRGDADAAIVEVEDQGAGFEQKRAESFFGLFVQGEQSLARPSGGLGIGLTISRRIAEMHGGTLRAHSDGPGRGARFTLRLPLARGAAQELVAKKAEPTHGARKQVLVVEDSADIRETMRVLLTHWGHDVLLASTGEEGLETFARAHPDIAIIDIGLPGMSGYELANCIRSLGPKPGGAPIRLVALTGYGQPSDAARARQHGFDAHLLKPLAPETLRATISA